MARDWKQECGHPFQPHICQRLPRQTPNLRRQVVNSQSTIRGRHKGTRHRPKGISKHEEQPPIRRYGAAGPIGVNDYFYWGLLDGGDVAPNFYQF